MRTYSLAEVAAIALPPAPTLKDPERWLRRHLNAGEIRGYRTGRIWRMTQDQLEWLIGHLSNTVTPTRSSEPAEPTAPVSIVAGMSARARARIQQQPNTSPRRRPA